MCCILYYVVHNKPGQRRSRRSRQSIYVEVPNRTRGARVGNPVEVHVPPDIEGSVRPGDNRPPYHPDDRRKPSWTCLWKYEQKKPHVNRWRKKSRG